MPVEAQFRSGRRIHGRFPQEVGSNVSIVVLERPIGVVALRRKEGPHLVFRRGEHQQIPLGIELTAGRLHHPLADDLTRLEVDRSRRIEVAELDVIGAFVHIESFNRFRDDEVQIGIALPMRMRSQIDRHPVGEERDIGPVIGIKPAQEILIGLSCAAGMFHGNEAGNQAKNLCRSALRLKHIFFVWNELLRRRGDRSIGQYRDFRHIHFRNIRIMSPGRCFSQS